MTDTPAVASSLLPLANRIAVITGASRGIGRAVAQRMARMGAHTHLVARDRAALSEAREEIVSLGVAVSVSICDLTSEAQIAALGKNVDDAGGCDILVNAAGIGGIGQPLHQMSTADFDAVLATNLRAPFLLMRALIPGMQRRGAGHIVNISSLAGQSPLANGAAYAASKWGLNGLTYSVAEELRNDDIRVSVVAPGSVDTGFGGAGSGKDPSRKLKAEDVAGVVAMIVTQPAQSFISEVRMRPTRKP